MNMNQWKQAIIASPTVNAIPVMTYPALELTGLGIMDVVTKGANQSKLVETLAARYPSAAAVTMMDLSVEAEAFGSEIKFSADEIPTAIGAIVTDLASVQALRVPEVGEKRTGEYVLGMGASAKAINDRPVFGGCIGPFSLAGRLLDINKAILATMRTPDVVHAVLEKCCEFLLKYMQAIKASGVDGVIMAEPLAGLLSPAGCTDFSSQYVKRLVAAVQDENFAVCLHNCGNTTKLVSSMASTGAAMLHFGNSIKMTDNAPQVPSDVLFCGNVDPAGIFRVGTPDQVVERTLGLLNDMKPYKNFVLSSGCDIPPKSPLANVDAFFETLARFNQGL
jgi:uroporphyrinogen decarboxylase